MSNKTSQETRVTTRIAPSPTGHLHIGTARTALVNFLFARKYGGRFILRSEDTDAARSTREFENEICDGLAWLKLEHDEFSRQSERNEIYTHYLNQLIDAGTAYISKEESKQTPGTFVEVVRLKNPNTTITFTDTIRGEISFDTTELGDMVIARAVDDPLYHLAVVIDDYESRVTHVIRGEDHISNTPRQILIQEALGFPRPSYAHLPLILAPDRSKLSKRHGAVALCEYRHAGYLPEAIDNYLALLGWNPGTDQEIFTLDELIASFDLGRVQKGGAVFDTEKLTWFNHQHLDRCSDESFLAYVHDWLPEQARTAKENDTEIGDRIERLLPELRERTNTLSDITSAFETGEYGYVFSKPTPTPEGLQWKNDAHPEEIPKRLHRIAEILKHLPAYPSAAEVKDAVWEYAETTGKGDVLWPLRVALSGRERSPDPFTLIEVLGRDESILRLEKACDTIEGA